MEPAERMALGMVDAERKRRQNVAGAEVFEIDGLLLAFSNLPDPQLNSVVVHHDPTDAVAAMEAAEREFVQRSHPIGIDLQVGRNPGVDEAVRSMGLIRIIERPGMALDVDEVPEAPVPHGIEIRPVTSDEDVRGLVEVGVQAFGDDPEVGMSCYGVSSRGVDGAEPSSRGGARNPWVSRPATCTRAPWGSWVSRWFLPLGRSGWGRH